MITLSILYWLSERYRLYTQYVTILLVSIFTEDYKLYNTLVTYIWLYLSTIPIHLAQYDLSVSH